MTGGLVAGLQQLHRLWESGALTAAEFAAAKQRMLPEAAPKQKSSPAGAKQKSAPVCVCKLKPCVCCDSDDDGSSDGNGYDFSDREHSAAASAARSCGGGGGGRASMATPMRPQHAYDDGNSSDESLQTDPDWENSVSPGSMANMLGAVRCAPPILLFLPPPFRTHPDTPVCCRIVVQRATRSVRLIGSHQAQAAPRLTSSEVSPKPRPADDGEAVGHTAVFKACAHAQAIAAAQYRGYHVGGAPTCGGQAELAGYGGPAAAAHGWS